MNQSKEALSAATPADQIVNVPVPVAALPLVHETLTRYYRSLSEPIVERITVPGNGEWSRDDIIWLRSRLRNEAGRAVMRFVAANSDRKVTYREMADAAGISFNQLRAQLGWLSKYAVKRKGRAVWPMTVTENSSLSAGERYQYHMASGIARWWLDAEAAAGEGTNHG